MDLDQLYMCIVNCRTTTKNVKKKNTTGKLRKRENGIQKFSIKTTKDRKIVEDTNRNTEHGKQIDKSDNQGRC